MPRFELSEDEKKFLYEAKQIENYWKNRNETNINPFNYYHGNSNLNVSSSGTSMKLSYIGPSNDNVIVGHISLWNSQK